MATCQCLTIAGSDPSGGAGIQGDLKTFSALHAYGMAVITALTAQNTQEVRGVFAIPADFVRQQLAAVLDDVRVDAAKTGMLADAEIIEEIVAELKSRSPIPLVVDPVMVSTTRARLLRQDAERALIHKLLPLATITTPNTHEAEVLVGHSVRTLDEAKRAARAICKMGPQAALVTGGQLDEQEDVCHDVLCIGDDVAVLESRRIPTQHTHGSGCATASAIAVGLGRGLDIAGAVDLARKFILRAIEAAGPLGKGYGPVNHLAATEP